MTPMNRSCLPGLVLAFAVLAASVAALLLGAGLAAREEQPGATLRPATTSQPLRLALPEPTPETPG
jgi:hypothetical protein